MKNNMDHMEKVLNRHISGFHRYVLTGCPHLSFASQNLCDMLGSTPGELLSKEADQYVSWVHPGDRDRYTDFIRDLSRDGQSRTLQYRMVRKNGELLYVSDTVTVQRLADGTLVGDSVLTDVTDLKKENENLKFLNETVCCGFIKYTCEKQPKITYVNDRLLQMLRFPSANDGESDYLALCKENLFLAIPMEERRRFAHYLRRVYRQGTPMAGEMTFLRCDGTKARLFGWVTRCVDENGKEEFQSVCMDVTDRYQRKRESEAKRYLKALIDVYDKIFEYDLADCTVKCLYAQKSAVFKWFENIPMHMREATEKWIRDTVFEGDRDRVRAFFEDFYKKKFRESDLQPPQIRYRAFSSDGELRHYTGIFLKTDASVSLFCCRRMVDTEETDLLRNENASLKENMQKLMTRFTDGIAAFEVIDNLVTPLYASDNVCKFFGFTKEEWMPMMKQSTPLADFVSRSRVAYEKFAELLQNGEAEFTYFDLGMKAERRIKAICSQKSPAGATPRYVMLYNVDDMKQGEEHNAEKCAVSIRTFGYFDVFVNGRAIAFRSEKAKELFALLVDRRGGYVSSEEAISFLWENEPVNAVTLARYRKVALRLKNILEEYGIAHVVESVDGKRRIVTDKVQCDLYDYLSGKEEYAQTFKGSYLSNYSWAEVTLGGLLNEGTY
ncbi:MAG: PAS domain-containing protein [Clostridia bacterium]|nr:PAS domain-containing protein [Clostridia bacterium]